MPIAGLKSSKWDPCRNKAQYLEQCMGQNDFNPKECQPQLADLKRCCERYQGKSVHCGFDPAVDPPDKHNVPLPDPDMPVKFKPAAPSTPGPGAKVKAAESFTPPNAKDKPDKASQEERSPEQHQHEASAGKGDTYLSLETKVKRAEAREHAAGPGLARAISGAADKLLHPSHRDQSHSTEKEQPHAERVIYAADVRTNQSHSAEPEEVQAESVTHAAERPASPNKHSAASEEVHAESRADAADKLGTPSKDKGSAQPDTAGQLSPGTLQRVEKHHEERGMAGAKIYDPAAAMQRAAGKAGDAGSAENAAEVSTARSGRSVRLGKAGSGSADGSETAQQAQRAQRGRDDSSDAGGNAGKVDGGGGNSSWSESSGESPDDSPLHILDERMQVPIVPKGTRGYQIIENMIEKKAERLAKEMDKADRWFNPNLEERERQAVGTTEHARAILRETIKACDNRDVPEMNICRIAEIGEGAPIIIFTTQLSWRWTQ